MPQLRFASMKKFFDQWCPISAKPKKVLQIKSAFSAFLPLRQLLF